MCGVWGLMSIVNKIAIVILIAAGVGSYVQLSGALNDTHFSLVLDLNLETEKEVEEKESSDVFFITKLNSENPISVKDDSFSKENPFYNSPFFEVLITPPDLMA